MDDNLDCLWSAACDPEDNCSGTLRTLFMFDADGHFQGYGDDWCPSRIRMCKISTFWELANWFELDLHDWDWIIKQGPPHKPLPSISGFMQQLVDRREAGPQQAAESAATFQKPTSKQAAAPAAKKITKGGPLS